VTIQDRTRAVLERVAQRLREDSMRALATSIERLVLDIDKPCMVAVVGRVKAGKSSFINALLGHDLAVVAPDEATATVNHFVYGRPTDPSRPVRCHWRGKPPTDHEPSFIDRLQGHDPETLQLAEGIRYLEYAIENPWLREITIVDTPGTGAVVDAHQSRVDEFLHSRTHLAERNAQETTVWGGKADAIIYLVGAAARGSDREFFEKAFGEGSGLKLQAMNTLGVMAKVDIDPELLQRRDELCALVAHQLEGRLNTVLPVSAATARALVKLIADNGRQLDELMTTLRRVPAPLLKTMLAKDSLFEREFPPEMPCPVSAETRRRLLRQFVDDGVPWGTFVQIAQRAGDPSLERPALVEQLEALSGFGPLKKKLDERFVQRSHFLRCNRIVKSAHEVVTDLRFVELPRARRESMEQQPRMQSLLQWIDKAKAPAELGDELRDLVRGRYDADTRVGAIETLLEDLDSALSELTLELADVGADFEALQRLDDHRDEFTSDERQELATVLGQGGLDLDHRLPGGSRQIGHVRQRQVAARQAALASASSARSAVFNRAALRYASLLFELKRAPAEQR
jgi:hypothetical protein